VSVDVVTLEIPARTEYLILARLALAGIARGVEIDQATLADLKLAVTEACGNAVLHAQPGDTGVVTVHFMVSDDAIEIMVEMMWPPRLPNSALAAVDPTSMTGANLSGGPASVLLGTA